MERFIIGVALAAAALFAVGAGTGGINLSINLSDHDGLRGGSGQGGQTLGAAEAVFAAKGVRFEDGVAVVKIVAEDRTDVAVSLASAGSTGLPAPLVRLEGDVLVLDGELGARVERCTSRGAEVKGVGAVTAETAPQILVRMPRAVAADIRSAGMADIGSTQSLDWRVRGCAPSKAGDVAGAAQIEKTGAGALSLAGAGSVEASIAGAGTLSIGAIREKLEANLAGSGEVRAASLTGALSADIAGSGSVDVEAGSITTADLEMAGSGSIRIAAPVAKLDVSAMGSGDVEVDGVVGDLDVELAGSGTVRVQKVTGANRQSVMGSGKVRVGE